MQFKLKEAFAEVHFGDHLLSTVCIMRIDLKLIPFKNLFLIYVGRLTNT